MILIPKLKRPCNSLFPVVRFYFYLLLVFSFQINIAQSYNKLKPACQNKIDSTYKALIKKYKVNGLSLAIVDKGEIVYSIGYGFSNVEKKTIATDKTIYRIGSCTKSFTSLSVLQLHQRNILDINQSVKNYLPELKIKSLFNDNNQIVVRDMLSHVSGLPCDIVNGFFCDMPPTINWEIQELNKQVTMSPSRYKHAYSNVAFGLLGEVIARKSNLTYAQYVQQNIFNPLQMNSSFIEMDKKWEADFSKAYVNNKVINEPLIRDAAAGLIHSTVLDMSNYIWMYLNKGKFGNEIILNEDLINEMQKNQIGDIYLSCTDSWGYGLYSKKVSVKENKDSSVVNLVEHGGDTYAFHADFGFIPESGVGAVILTNTDNGVRINTISRLLKIYLKETYDKKLNLNYEEKNMVASSKEKEKQILETEKKGVYSFGSFVMNVKNEKKIKFKQGPATVILTQKQDEKSNYKVKARVFGFIPIKIRDQELKFVKRDNNTYLKGLNTKTKEEDYIALKSTSPTELPTWKNAQGTYKVIGENYKCTNCPYMNSENISMKIAKKKNLYVVQTKAKSADMNNTSYLDLINDTIAVTGGIGRGNGETVRILKSGNIYYSGFEFKREY